MKTTSYLTAPFQQAPYYSGQQMKRWQCGNENKHNHSQAKGFVGACRGTAFKLGSQMRKAVRWQGKSTTDSSSPEWESPILQWVGEEELLDSTSPWDLQVEVLATLSPPSQGLCKDMGQHHLLGLLVGAAGSTQEGSEKMRLYHSPGAQHHSPALHMIWVAASCTASCHCREISSPSAAEVLFQYAVTKKSGV